MANVFPILELKNLKKELKLCVDKEKKQNPLCVSGQFGEVHAAHSGGHHHPEVPEDVCGAETLQAEAGCCAGHADHPQSLHGPAEVPGGETRHMMTY